MFWEEGVCSTMMGGGKGTFMMKGVEQLTPLKYKGLNQMVFAPPKSLPNVPIPTKLFLCFI